MNNLYLVADLAADTKVTFVPFIIIGCVFLFIIAGVIVAIGVKNHKKNNTNNKGFIKVDQKFVDELVEYYGGISNIKSVGVENARLTIEVNDLDIVNLDKIRENSNGGVFVKFNVIKTLYKTDSSALRHLILSKKR